MNYTEDEYKKLLQNQWNHDQELLLSNGIVTPWDINGGVMDDDEARALKIAYDELEIQWSPSSKAYSRPTVDKMGLKKHGNAKFVLDKLINNGLLKAEGATLVLTDLGLWRYEMHLENYDGDIVDDHEEETTDQSLGGLFG